MTGPLKNARHERFAQELAKGSTADAAYVAAGYRPDRKNAARLTTNDAVRARITELKSRAAARTEITVASVTRRLLRIAAKGERLREASGLQVARAAVMDAAKLNGLAPERHEHTGKNGGPIEYRDLGEDEIDARLNALKDQHGHHRLAH
jgi:phage terminase small subunit